MIKHFSEKLAHIFVVNNLNLYFGEIDILLLSPKGELVVVEVKSVGEEMSFRRPIAKAQIRRLTRVFNQLAAGSKRPVRMHFAAVNHLNQVEIFYDFLADVSL